MFVSNLEGLLMKIEEEPTTRYRFEVWFDYTRDAINKITEGAMIAVPNFAGNNEEVHYSILEITGILPVHYALGKDMSGYPGFVVEAAKNAGQDWLTQENISTEDTTKIRCIAIPMNLEIVTNPLAINPKEPDIEEEKNLPMVGHEARLLNTEMTEKIANLALDLKHDNVTQIGTLQRDENVNIYLSVEDLIKVHFGIFGFTGAGKSNILSTLIRKLFIESKDPLKIVIFDLMSEYTALLIDQLHRIEGARIINLSAQTVPESVLTYYRERTKGNAEQNKENLRKATIDFVNTTVLPKALKRRQNELYRPLAVALHDNKILFWQQKRISVIDIIETARSNFKGAMGGCEQDVYNFVKKLSREFQNTSIDVNAFKNVESKIETFIEQYNGNEENKKANKQIKATARKNLDLIINSLKSEAEKVQVETPALVSVSMSNIVKQLNDENQHSILIVQAHDPDTLREFASKLAHRTYESRRQTGQITPLVSFVFDEADEFIPGQTSNDSQKKTKGAVMLLARRGRKFGLGIGIATQRIANLDVNTLAQPHTYFVSKLPRQYDRQAIANAFGISEDMFRQTFKFKKGDWLLASYDAAGLEAIPIPIHAENAEDKVFEFLVQINGGSST
jgi:hypothetical protein